MGVILVASMKVKDADKLAQYRAASGPMARAVGGELLAKGNKLADLAGSTVDGGLVVFRFPDEATFRTWWDSDEYKQLIPLRDEAAEGVFTLYEE
ncbi:MAG: DUF1330 domain-containing protein [Immundisolibacteraceae bacterium]|nr:DUF1330 domain-containing protein [Immundisolibacteraceae bacterium]